MNIFSNVKSKLVIASTSLLLSASTFAAEGDTATNYATEAMNSLKAQATELIAQTWPVVTVVVGAGLAIRLFKKFSSKAV
ncbi:capsid protein [Salmonella enterica]|uniref:major coat protein n=1 Tax=Salmonella enterica TaxID=28901 RepID=UPI0009B156FB|nr:major coat protein [Salmonella enterica]EBE8963146.1 capsid protein [Salmonella enterica]EBQ5510205.1 capsid protein [Salmonella enterica]EGM6560558.1 capsid protein [Salmonella enterica]EGS3183886.1 capsid protein [Salmonella enterica]EJF5179801.1 capsid protein [Salmonella enterica]